jgi:hypothetical protein
MDEKPLALTNPSCPSNPDEQCTTHDISSRTRRLGARSAHACTLPLRYPVPSRSITPFSLLSFEMCPDIRLCSSGHAGRGLSVMHQRLTRSETKRLGWPAISDDFAWDDSGSSRSRGKAVLVWRRSVPIGYRPSRAHTLSRMACRV